MSAEIINLKQARKARERAEKEAEADANRLKFGRTKAERALNAAEQDHHNRQLDGAKVSPTGARPASPSSNAPLVPEVAGRAANEGTFPTVASHDDDDDLDPGNVS